MPRRRPSSLCRPPANPLLSRRYGRGAALDDPVYGYVRDIDYGTAACLLVSRTLFHSLNMYDRRYAENQGAYYEDTDLSFEVRHAGYRVLYQPFAHVLHYGACTRAVSPSGRPLSPLSPPRDPESMSYGVQKPQKQAAKPAATEAAAAAASANRKKELMRRGKAKFADEWRAQLSCHYLHRSIASQADAYMAGTRLSLMHVLVVAPYGDAVGTAGKGPSRSRAVLVAQVLLAMRVHVTFVNSATAVGRGGAASAGADDALLAPLQYLGVEAHRSFETVYWPIKTNKKQCKVRGGRASAWPAPDPTPPSPRSRSSTPCSSRTRPPTAPRCCRCAGTARPPLWCSTRPTWSSSSTRGGGRCARPSSRPSPARSSRRRRPTG